MFDPNTKKETNNMKAVFVGLFLIVLIAAITLFNSRSTDKLPTKNEPELTQSEQSSVSAKKITAEELAKKIQANSRPTLLDIRDENQYKNEHIVDSINIALSKISAISGALGTDKSYVIVDDSGDMNNIAAATNALSDKDYKNVAYLDGGFAAWKSNFNPTIANGDPKSFTDQAKVKYTTSDNLKKLIETEKNLLLIDVRQSAEFNAGHIAGAINIFLDNLEMRRKELPFGKKIILYDNNSLGAFKGAARLFDLGYFNTLALSDGLDSWKIKGYAITK